MKKLRLAVLAGGRSGEREISLKSGELVCRSLDKSKYNVVEYDLFRDLKVFIESINEIDLAFVLLHGKFGEDGSIHGLLNILGIPYVGSGVLSSAMSMNKKVAKEIFKTAGLAVVKDVPLRRGESFSIGEIIDVLGPAAIVKPVAEGSSLGVSLCRNKEELFSGIETAFQYDKDILVEEYLEGRETSCCVMGDRDLDTLPLIEIVPIEKYGFFNSKAKYTPNTIKEICPAPFNAALTKRVQECAKKAHRALRCSVWSRTDMIIRGEDIFLLETNTIPGMTENSLFPLAARSAGISMTQLLDRLIMLSL